MIVTKKAPDFTAPAVLGNNQIVEDFNLYKNIGSKGAVVFFYPKDFTFVCPSEIIAFDKRYKEFKDRGTSGLSGVSFLSGCCKTSVLCMDHLRYHLYPDPVKNDLLHHPDRSSGLKYRSRNVYRRYDRSDLYRFRRNERFCSHRTCCLYRNICASDLLRWNTHW